MSVNTVLRGSAMAVRTVRWAAILGMVGLLGSPGQAQQAASAQPRTAAPPSGIEPKAMDILTSILAFLRDVKPRRTSARLAAAAGVLFFPRFVRAPANSNNRPATGSGSRPPLPTAPV